ncbi:hypothetical protein J6590_059200 [Homalodisca vitripennis]|nr:hypothetical protein J6590_059200 [Homalodisca vitripennis]
MDGCVGQIVLFYGAKGHEELVPAEEVKWQGRQGVVLGLQSRPTNLESSREFQRPLTDHETGRAEQASFWGRRHNFSLRTLLCSPLGAK